MERPEKSYNETFFDFNTFYSETDRERIKKEWIKYIDSKYKVGYSEMTHCVPMHNGAYQHFGINPKAARMYGERPENVVECKVTIIEDHVRLRDYYKQYNAEYDENSIDYFGWINYNDDDTNRFGISVIQPNVKVFSIQFAGGGDKEVEHGIGKIVRLKVEII